MLCNLFVVFLVWGYFQRNPNDLHFILYILYRILFYSGYSANVFGLSNKSNVATETTIKVLPSLPQLRVKVLPKQDKPSASNSTSHPGLNTDTLKRKSLSDSTFELMDGEEWVYSIVYDT